MHDFTGPLFHTSAYQHDVDLEGKRVALIGTGSSACQLAPEIVSVVEQLDLYQREPGHVMPKKVRRFSVAEMDARNTRMVLQKKLDRYRAFRNHGKFSSAFSEKSKQQAALRAFAESYIARSVLDDETRFLLTPPYPYGCKRPVFSSQYYKIFNRPNVKLVPKAVTRLTSSGVVDTDGVERPADVVIMATGFRATEYQRSIAVTGGGGRDLRTFWGDSPSAFLGITVPGFPNFFMIYGPNTNGGTSVLASLERQAEVIAKAVVRLQRAPGTHMDTRLWAAAAWDRWVQRRLGTRGDVFDADCHNYYHSASGKNVTQLPMSAPMYLLATRLLASVGFIRRQSPHEPRRHTSDRPLDDQERVAAPQPSTSPL
jgi:cation diffusion facilitator CzcD-associated flavoprotein CzcO